MSSTTSPASRVSGEVPPPHVVEDCLGLVQLLSDGTVKRAPATLVLADDTPTPPDDGAAPIRWKDVVYDEARWLSLRMYVPSARAGDDGSTEKKKKLPVLVYFHGGGFIIGSFASPEFHAVCLRLAAELPAAVLSADYRLALEHRLPAAVKDADTVLSWLGEQQAAGAGADPWLADAADFGRVFVSGDSAGANIAHHAAARAVASGSGLRLAGCVLLWPYFGGERRTASEAACSGDVFLTIPLYDQMWRLALPAGETRDHPTANPFDQESAGAGGSAPVNELPPLLVAIGDGDMLIDRAREYVACVKQAAAAAGNSNRRVDLVEFNEAGHEFAIFEPDGEAAGELVRVVRRFVHGGDHDAAPAPRNG